MFKRNINTHTHLLIRAYSLLMEGGAFLESIMYIKHLFMLLLPLLVLRSPIYIRLYKERVCDFIPVIERSALADG